MKTTKYIIGSLLILLFTHCGEADIQGDIMIQNVHIVDVEQSEIIPGQTISIVDDEIVSITPFSESQQTEGQIVINGRDKYVIPGLWDMHTHVFSTNSDSTSHRMDLSNKLMIANGVTGFREMGYATEEAAQLFREGLRKDDYLPQRFIYANLVLDGDPPVYDQPQIVKALKTGEQAEAAIDSILTYTKADFIKIYSVLSPEVFHAIAAYCNKHQIDFAGHFPVHVPLSEIAESGIKSLEHGYELVPAFSDQADAALEDQRLSPPEYRQMFDDHDDATAEAFFNKLRENDVWITPTLTINKGLARFSASDSLVLSDERRKYVDWKSWEGPPPAAHPFYEERFTLIEERIQPAHQAGVGILAGTDAGFSNPLVYDGFSLHEELQLLVEAGMPPFEVLKTATLNPAKYMNATDSLGTVEEGKKADLVLLHQNPFEDIRNTQEILGVISSGEYFDRTQLDELLNEVESYYSDEL